MNKTKAKRIGKLIVKSFLTLIFVCAISVTFLTGGLKVPGNPLSHKEVTPFDSFVQKTFEFSETITEEPLNLIDLLPEYVDVPKGGTPWTVFAETKEHPFTYKEDDEFEYVAIRPEFSDEIKALDGTVVTVQGYMFPLGHEEKQSLFLLGPFPASCPFHYHIPAKLIIEVHAKTPIAFSYDAIDIKGTLELVPRDDEYNVFYRLKNAEIAQ